MTRNVLNMKKLLFLTIFFAGFLFVGQADAAIAFNSSSTGGTGSGTQVTVASGDVSGSDRAVIIAITIGGGDNLNGLSYDGENIFGKMVAKTQYGDYANRCYMFLHSNPPTGVKNVSATVSAANNIYVNIISYTGVLQSDTVNASATKKQSSGTSISQNVTTTADNAWLVSSVCTVGTSVTAGANTVKRAVDPGPHSYAGDSNTDQTPAGSYSQAYSWTGSDNNAIIVAALAPAELAIIEPNRSVIIIISMLNSLYNSLVALFSLGVAY